MLAFVDLQGCQKAVKLNVPQADNPDEPCGKSDVMNTFLYRF